MRESLRLGSHPPAASSQPPLSCCWLLLWVLRYHKVHHELTAPIGISAFYMHPYEASQQRRALQPRETRLVFCFIRLSQAPFAVLQTCSSSLAASYLMLDPCRSSYCLLQSPSVPRLLFPVAYR